MSRKRQRKSSSVTFSESEEVINPGNEEDTAFLYHLSLPPLSFSLPLSLSFLTEDIDPSVGRFRNLVQSSVVIPSKVLLLLILSRAHGILIFSCNRFFRIVHSRYMQFVFFFSFTNSVHVMMMVVVIQASP